MLHLPPSERFELFANTYQVAKSIGGAPDLGAFPDIPSMRKFLADAKANASAAGGEFPDVKETDHQVSMVSLRLSFSLRGRMCVY